MVIFAIPTLVGAQAPRLVSEPVLGAQTPTSVRVWFMVADCDSVALTVEKDVYKLSTAGRYSWNGHVPMTVDVTGLQPGSRVSAQLSTQGKPLGNPFTLATAPASPQPSWSFTVGSCAFYGVGLTGLITPGRHVDIFPEMTKLPSDMMVWLGDNVYLLNGEWNDRSRMYEKYTKVRLEPLTNAFLRSRPQYAILDDHDYGPDNAGGDFPNKAETRTCFQDFWPNPAYGDGQAASYYHFDYQDAAFFMLDDRWYRKAEGNVQIIGPEQLAWLKAQLKASTATFKFIAHGSQVVSTANAHETWSRFAERQALLDFIRTEHITGVVFLSGDRHFTELCKLEQDGMYPLYDFTSSPISSIVRKRVDRPGDVEYDHALRVPGTKVVAHNFGRVVIEGPVDARICRLETYDAYGKLLWQHEIAARDLDWAP